LATDRTAPTIEALTNMRTQTINAVCLLLAGLAAGWLWSPIASKTAPSGELMPRERTVETGVSLKVDLRLRNRPPGARIVWNSDAGHFDPEETNTDLQSTFTAPTEQRKVRLWVDLIDGEHVYQNVAWADLDVSRSVEPIAQTSSPTSGSPAAETASNDIMIRLTTVPQYDSVGGPTTSAYIEGDVTGVRDPDQFRIVVYAKTGATWWVQPLVAAPFTPLDNRGQFSTWTHTGTSYAVLLVRRGFLPPAAVDGDLPMGKDIVARAQVAGRAKGV
jgi:hypothetical protein